MLKYAIIGLFLKCIPTLYNKTSKSVTLRYRRYPYLVSGLVLRCNLMPVGLTGLPTNKGTSYTGYLIYRVSHIYRVPHIQGISYTGIILKAGEGVAQVLY